MIIAYNKLYEEGDIKYWAIPRVMLRYYPTQ